ncbi:unnamed protein product [Rhodiola kirilowii]
MEIESDNGDKINLKPNSRTQLGRGFGIQTNDRSVSRRHIWLELHSNHHKAYQNSKPRVSFEVVGKNPVWVRSGESGEIRVYRKGEGGELGSGDAFSVSGKKHFWFRLIGEVGERVEDEGFEDVSDLEFESFDVSNVDPVKEFGFIIMGHDFDSYRKKMLHDAKNWNWFLDAPKKGSDDEDDVGQASRRPRRKRKKGKHDYQGDDDEWEGESEEDKELVSKTKKVPRPTFSTRSKDRGKVTKTRMKGNDKFKSHDSGISSEMGMGNADDNEDKEEDDETLGGFIVDDEELTEDDTGGEGDGDEEEEEFEDDDEDKDLE